MYEIELTFTFEYAHRLMKHSGKCWNIHGHSGKAVCNFASEGLDQNQFVADFGEIKAPIKRWIDNHWDHALLLYADDPFFRHVSAFEAKQNNPRMLKLYAFHTGDPTAEIMALTLHTICVDVASELRKDKLIAQWVEIQETCTGKAIYKP